MDLKESLASLCFAASCCADLPELQEIRDIMVMKYGKDFLTSAHELLPGEHVNRLVKVLDFLLHILGSITSEFTVCKSMDRMRLHGVGPLVVNSQIYVCMQLLKYGDTLLF